MDIEKITDLITQLKESEHRWKALYHSTWIASKKIRQDYENTEYWNTPLGYFLPASSKKAHIYPSGKYLHSIMTGRDGEIALNHMTNMLSLLEKLVKEIHCHMYPGEKPLYTGSRKLLVDFLLKNGFLLPEEQNEFWLAGETRNCVIHNGHELDDKWVKAYNNARNASFLTSITTDLYRAVPLPQVEEWHTLFLRITDRMEKVYLGQQTDALGYITPSGPQTLSSL